MRQAKYTYSREMYGHKVITSRCVFIAKQSNHQNMSIINVLPPTMYILYKRCNGENVPVAYVDQSFKDKKLHQVFDIDVRSYVSVVISGDIVVRDDTKITISSMVMIVGNVEFRGSCELGGGVVIEAVGKDKRLIEDCKISNRVSISGSGSVTHDVARDVQLVGHGQPYAIIGPCTWYSLRSTTAVIDGTRYYVHENDILERWIYNTDTKKSELFVSVKHKFGNDCTIDENSLDIVTPLLENPNYPTSQDAIYDNIDRMIRISETTSGMKLSFKSILTIDHAGNQEHLHTVDDLKSIDEYRTIYVLFRAGWSQQDKVVVYNHNGYLIGSEGCCLFNRLRTRYEDDSFTVAKSTLKTLKIRDLLGKYRPQIYVYPNGDVHKSSETNGSSEISNYGTVEDLRYTLHLFTTDSLNSKLYLINNLNKTFFLMNFAEMNDGKLLDLEIECWIHQIRPDSLDVEFSRISNFINI